MTYVAPSTVVAGQTYSAASHNIIVNDIIDHESRLLTLSGAEYPYRNLFYNGAMQIAQRGTSTASITSSGYYTADRWQALTSGTIGTWTSSVENDAPTGTGLRKSLKWLCTTANATLDAGDLLYIAQSLEGQDVQRVLKGSSSALPLTLSFWVKSNLTGDYTARIQDIDNTRHVAASYNISASGVWEQKSITFPADTTGVFDNDNAESLRLGFWLVAGNTYTSGTLQTTWGSTVSANSAVSTQANVSAATNNYWQITGVQLEAGSVASPFEFLPYGDELARCQRYYEKSFAIDQAPTDNPANKRGALHLNVDATQSYALFPSVVFRTEKRSAPTMSFFNPHTTTAGQACNVNSPFAAVPLTTSIGAAANSETTSGFTVGVNNSSVTALNQLMVHWVASAEL